VCGAGGKSTVYTLYTPTILINIGGVDDALRDRIIEIQSVPRGRAVDRFRLHEQRDTLQQLRDQLYHFACASVGEICEAYHTCPQVADIGGRREELWLPVFSLAKVIDTTTEAPKLFDEMVQFAGEIHTQKDKEEQFAARDTRIIAGLYFFLENQELLDKDKPEVKATELTSFIKAAEDIPDLRMEEVSRVLGRAKLIDKKFRRRIADHGSSTNPLVHYALNVNGVKERAQTLGLLPQS
jgi:hypothetical protein